MKLTMLNCNHCGAPLEVPAKTRYVTCGYCHARLEIHREGNAVYSEVLEQIQQRTEQLADDVQTIKLQNEVEALDRQWMMERDNYTVRSKSGHVSVPSKAGVVVTTIFFIGFALFWLSMATRMHAPSFFPLFGVVFVVIAIANAVRCLNKANGFSRARSDYESQRHELLGRLRRHDR